MIVLKLVMPTPQPAARTNARETIERRTVVELISPTKKAKKFMPSKTTTHPVNQSMEDHRPLQPVEIISSPSTSRKRIRVPTNPRELKLPLQPQAQLRPGTPAADTVNRISKLPKD